MGARGCPGHSWFSTVFLSGSMLAGNHALVHNRRVMSWRVEDYEHELAAAAQSYEKYVVCIDKTPDDFLKALQSLLTKALDAYEKRAPGLRHGIALDRQVTIMISENNGDRPLCGIYFNLSSPYRKKSS